MEKDHLEQRNNEIADPKYVYSCAILNDAGSSFGIEEQIRRPGKEMISVAFSPYCTCTFVENLFSHSKYTVEKLMC